MGAFGCNARNVSSAAFGPKNSTASESGSEDANAASSASRAAAGPPSNTVETRPDAGFSDQVGAAGRSSPEFEAESGPALTNADVKSPDHPLDALARAAVRSSGVISASAFATMRSRVSASAFTSIARSASSTTAARARR